MEEESSNYGWEWWGRLPHLHLAVGLRAVLVLHMPETNGNKAFTRFTADTTTRLYTLPACAALTTYMGGGRGSVSARLNVLERRI